MHRQSGDKREAWGVLLAGGDGTRLQSLTELIEGDPRPKQFARVLGEESLLNQTRCRIRPLFGGDRTIVVVTKKHEVFYECQLSDLPRTALVVQPENRGTGIAIATAISVLLARNADPVVAFFPCDHYYTNEAAFLNVVEAGLAAAENNPDKIVLLGAEPTYPETDYGWIEPMQASSDPWPTRIRRFWEKPALPMAQEILNRGGLWNTFVTIGRASTFLDLLCAAVPDAMLALSAEHMANDGAPCYQPVPFVDFSRDVLSSHVERLLVVRDETSGWTDLGRPSRVIDMLAHQNIVPAWLETISGAAPL